MSDNSFIILKVEKIEQKLEEMKILKQNLKKLQKQAVNDETIQAMKILENRMIKIQEEVIKELENGEPNDSDLQKKIFL